MPRPQDEITASWRSSGPPLASICTLTFNHADYLRQALDSLLEQVTDFPFEILIHDDASTDGTTEIVREYAAAYPAIVRTVIQEENQYSQTGILIAEKFLYPIAHGEFIAICEGDDYWDDAAKLQKQVDFLRENPRYVITYGRAIAVNEEGPLPGLVDGLDRDASAEELRRGVALNTLTVCFRNKIPPVHPDLLSARLSDMVQWSLLGAHGDGKFLDTVRPSYYRVHEGGIHSMVGLKQKRISTLITYNALAAYYFRTGENDTAEYLMLRSMQLAQKIAGLRKVSGYILKGLRSRLAGRK